MNEPSAIQVIINTITDVVEYCATWIDNFAQCIVSNPLILLFVIVAFVGLGVGLLSRLMHL